MLLGEIAVLMNHVDVNGETLLRQTHQPSADGPSTRIDPPMIARGTERPKPPAQPNDVFSAAIAKVGAHCKLRHAMN
jgi:hypothetical protein